MTRVGEPWYLSDALWIGILAGMIALLLWPTRQDWRHYRPARMTRRVRRMSALWLLTVLGFVAMAEGLKSVPLVEAGIARSVVMIATLAAESMLLCYVFEWLLQPKAVARG